MSNRFGSSRSLWKQATKLEKILIFVLLIAIVIIIILAVLAANKPGNVTSKICNSSTCLNEASKIVQYVDLDLNPCDDFYKFSCGKFLKNAHGDENLYLLNRIPIQAKRELIEIYTEPVKSDDHFMVKMSKNLFKTCVKETIAETENIETIKQAIKLVGGWPVIEGSAWNEINFDWLEATYKLRESGYYYSIFLNLLLENDSENPSRYVFKVSTPNLWDYSSINFNKIEFMTETAIIFGAKDKNKTLAEMTATHNFLTQLQVETHNRYNIGNSTKFAVRKYQQKYGPLDWLKFINTIAGPKVNIGNNDTVIFPPAPTLKSWFDLIKRTPKRIQANYMMWKVIEHLLPYLSENMQNPNSKRRKQENRMEFCLKEVQKIFVPSPIDIIYTRKYLPLEKKKMVESLLSDVKSELVKALEGAKWIDENDKKEAVQKANNIQMIVGHPANYWEDRVLDDLNIDMIDVKNGTFVALLAQANKNKQTSTYMKIKTTPLDNIYENWYYNNGATLPVYDVKKNLLYVHAINTAGVLYNENSPLYLNFGALGTVIGQQLSDVLVANLRGTIKQWSVTSLDRFKSHLECMKKDYVDLKLDQFEIFNMVQLHIGSKLSYAAYNSRPNEDEPNLIGINYSPKQLFWISGILAYCQPVNQYSEMGQTDVASNKISAWVSEAIRNNPAFAEDFNCSPNSKMNPSIKCEIL